MGNTACDLDICGCPNGTPLTGSSCLTHNHSPYCDNCNSGYYLQTKECKIEKNCVCPNGTPKDVQSCSTEGATECTSCDGTSGYILDPNGSETCIENVCTCTHGVPASGGDCPTNEDQHKCMSCDAGRYLNEINQCPREKHCDCPNGTPKDVQTCSATGEHECESCNTGYHIDNDDHCEINQCLCINGDPSQGLTCPEHDKFRCDTCNAGFHFNPAGTNCKEDRFCDCPHGTPASVEDCPDHGVNMCSTCDTGYILSDNDRCDEECWGSHYISS